MSESVFSSFGVFSFENGITETGRKKGTRHGGRTGNAVASGMSGFSGVVRCYAGNHDGIKGACFGMTKSVVVGLTGNMGAGKSTAVKMIREMVIPVFEADQAVHILMRDNREMKALFFRKFPESLVNDEIDRTVLSRLINEKKLDIRQLEQMIYPFLEKELQNFFMRHSREPVVVLDVPLLFEAGWDRFCDKIIVVSAPAEVLKQRVFERALVL